MNHFFFLDDNMDLSNPNEDINKFITTGDLPDLSELAVTGDFFNTVVPLKTEDISPFTTTGDLQDFTENDL